VAVPRRETIIPRAAAKASASSSDDLLQMPVRGRVRTESTSKKKTGVDIATKRGAEIGAAADGKVVFAGRQAGYGNTVVIEHEGGRMTRYANLARITVAEGTSVEKGQTVALAGKSGRSGKSHVHFEVVESGRQIDPLAAVSRDRAAARAQQDILADATPTLARAAEAAESILAPTPALAVTATTATSPLRASVILPAGTVRAVSNEVLIPGALGRRPTFQSKEVSLSLPAHGRISSNFGVRRDPFTGRARVHEGVDIAVPSGTPIHAAAAGTVVFAGKQRGYGNTVIVEHADGRKTRYAHASKLNVTVGETVGKGETIGLVGSTGRSTGPHLHFEVIEAGRHVNPLAAVAHDSRLAGR
jgi:murein DD-endopeptidase MepM/ murein hydrolase activator NlpD